MAQEEPQNQVKISAMEQYQQAAPSQNDEKEFMMMRVIVNQFTKNNLRLIRQIQKRRTTNRDKVVEDQLPPDKWISYMEFKAMYRRIDGISYYHHVCFGCDKKAFEDLSGLTVQ